MQTPEEFIIQHGNQPYDPLKAHEYYIRNRKLKGRKRGVKISPKRLTGDRVNEKTDTIVLPDGRVVRDPSVPRPKLITTKRQAQVQSRVKVLRGKLNLLNTILNKLVNEAKASANEPVTKKATKSVATKKSAADTNRKPLTSAQKSEAAKKQRVRYRKEHPESDKKKADKERETQIEEVRAMIEKVKAELKAAIIKAKENATRKRPAAMGRRTLRKENQNGSR